MRSNFVDITPTFITRPDDNGFEVTLTRLCGFTLQGEPEFYPTKANLHKAAPDLYEALRRIMDELPQKRDWLDPVLEQEAKAALAKAGS